VLANAAPLASARPADARVVRLEITRVEPFLAGHAFGTAGTFERVIGRAEPESAFTVSRRPT